MERGLEFTAPDPSLVDQRSILHGISWAEETRTGLSAFGSWTIKKARRKRGVEADQCYFVGASDDDDIGGRSEPDLAIEVVWSTGGLDKLEIYRGLNVKEVWFWKAGTLEVYVLGKAGYAQRAKSRLLPALDLQLVAKYARATAQQQAIREFRQAVRKVAHDTPTPA